MRRKEGKGNERKTDRQTNRWTAFLHMTDLNVVKKRKGE